MSNEKLKRAFMTLAGTLLIFAMLLARIFWIQTVDFDKYLKKVVDQINTQSSVSADRGIIYDRCGNVLAANITTYRVFISPLSIRSRQRESDKSGGTENYAELISRGLSDILRVDYDTVYKQTTYTRYLDRTVAKGTDDKTADKVRAFINENGYHDMVYVEAQSERYYPCSTLASSVIGFTSSDGKGLYGLESYYDEVLSGSDGYYITARDSYGNEMPGEYEAYVPATSGANLTTTIDTYIQSVLEKNLIAAVNESDAKNRACGIVVNVKTGAVLAMATVPGFDLNDPWELNDYYLGLLNSDGLEEGSEEYKAARSEYLLDMWRNKAVSDSYIPGSTFKIITSAAGLSEGKVSLVGDSVFCGGSLHLYGYTIHCHKRLGHGSLTFAQGLVQSCNVWFMTLGERLGINTFYDYFRSFGYLDKTGIDLPGEAGSVVKTENAMTGLDLAIYSFGQNFNVTPIQHIMAVSAVANGGYLLEPYLVEEITDSDGNVTYHHDSEAKRQVVSTDVCKTISSILEGGVSGDGGAKNAYVAGYKIAAKTGTSEKKGTEIRVDGVKAYVCSCVAYAPADDPEIAVLMMVDEPSRGVLYGSVVAAPYISDFLSEVLPYLDIEKDTEQSNETAVPSFEGMSVSYASDLAAEYGYEVIVKGDGEYITSQVPRAETKINKTNKTVTFYTSNTPPDNSVAVPDLVGMSAYEANRLIINSRLNICIEGADNYMIGSGATVIEQSLPPNTMVSEGTVITVRFRYLDESE